MIPAKNFQRSSSLIASHLRILIVAVIRHRIIWLGSLLALRLLPVVDASVSPKTCPSRPRTDPNSHHHVCYRFRHHRNDSNRAFGRTAFRNDYGNPARICRRPGNLDTSPDTGNSARSSRLCRTVAFAVFDLAGKSMQHITVTTGTVRYWNRFC